MTKKSYPRITTPRGVLIYPHITEPDTKFVKPDGEYHTKFALPADDEATMAFVSKLQAELDAYIEANPDELPPAKLKKATRAELYEEELDDEGNETGRLIFKFKLKAMVKTKTKQWPQKPRLFDAAAQPIEGALQVWSGSEGKCNLEVFPYFMETTKQFGLSLRLKGVQILKLVSGGGDTADDMGFGAEDGFINESGAAANGFTPEDGEEDGDDSEF